MVVALVSGALSILASLLGVAYLKQRDLREEATAAVARAEAAAATARAEANKGERAREQAQDFVGFMMKDLRKALVPIGRSDVLEKIAEEALDYFENLPPDLVTAETDAQQAAVWKTLGGARYNLGNLKGAVAADRRAIELLEKLVLIDPSNEAQRRELALVRLGMAQVLLAAGQRSEAREVFNEGLEGESEGPLIAEAEAGLAELELVEGNLQKAQQRNAKAIRLLKNGLDRFPGNISYRKMLTITYGNAGIVAAKMGDEAEAERLYRESLASGRKLIALDPDNRNWEKELATLLNNVGLIYEKKGEIDQAEEFFNESLEIRKGLVGWDPNNTRWLLNLANSWHNDAALHYHRKQGGRVLDSSRKALEIFRQLLTLEPENEVWLDEMREMLSIAQSRLTGLEETTGALALSEETTKFLENLKKGNPESFATTAALAKVRREMGKIVKREGGDAVAQYRLAAEAFAKELGDELDEEKVVLLVQSYLDLARSLEDPEEARQCFALAHTVMVKHVKTKSRHHRRLRDFALREITLRTEGLRSIIPAGSEWRYWDGEGAPAADWTTKDFDESAWRSGVAPLGYGNGNEETELRFGNDPQDKRVTAWFRRTFEVEKVPSSLRLNLQRDDGAVVYLNGREVLRDGMPDGRIEAGTFANLTAQGFSERVFHSFVISGEQLKEGANVLAVEVHQNEPVSSDLRLDLELWDEAIIPRPAEILSWDKIEKTLGADLLPSSIR